MALYAIGDLHLSENGNKSMEVFGGAWQGYVEKLRQSLWKLQKEDTVVLAGDLSWAMGLDAARADFAWMNQIPGRKILVKGNHDYWWNTAAKFERYCRDNGFENFCLLNNNCFFYEEYAICGTRGWFFEEDRGGEHDEKIFHRELMRLEASLRAGGDRLKLCFLHYPPRYSGYQCGEILELLHRYGVRRCFYGHLHGQSHRLAQEGIWDGIEFRLISADFLDFKPLQVQS